VARAQRQTLNTPIQARAPDRADPVVQPAPQQQAEGIGVDHIGFHLGGGDRLDAGRVSQDQVDAEAGDRIGQPDQAPVDSTVARCGPAARRPCAGWRRCGRVGTIRFAWRSKWSPAACFQSVRQSNTSPRQEGRVGGNQLLGSTCLTTWVLRSP
jgi:hypothetical protein